MLRPMQIVLLLLCVFSTASRGQVAEAPTSMDELQRLYDAGDYQATIRGITRITSLRTTPDGFKLLELWNLKGECHLRLKQTPLAVESFERAAEAAEDDHARAIADTTARLIRDSSALNYRPKVNPPGSKPTPIDVVDSASRPRAIEAYFVDELEDAQSNTSRVIKAGQLPRMFRAIEDLSTLRNTELAAKGTDDTFRQLQDKLVDACATLMNSELVQMNARVEAASKTALTRTTARDGSHSYRGLNPQERMALQQSMKTCEQIAMAVDELHPKAGDKLKERLDVIRGDARTVHALADAVLRRDYSGRYRETP